MTRPSGRLITLIGMLAAIVVMGSLVSYSVTLYRLFCEATGAGGTTERVAGTDGATSTREVTVFFDANTSPALPWRFAPVQRSVTVKLGEPALIYYEAENLSDKEYVGHATFNVTPEKTGSHFKKIECFCFTEERLAPHEKVEMPVEFYVDADLATTPDTAEVHQITLSYTFFNSLRPAGAEDLARFAHAPDAGIGAKLFATNCTACHATDASHIGPKLAGVVGRPAGSVTGFDYSDALAHSGITWDTASLDRWLAGPGAMVPGTHMPLALPDAQERADIIAYLRSLAPARAAQQGAPPAPRG